MTTSPTDKARALVVLALRYVRDLVPALACLPVVPLACIAAAALR